jgi:hypothetical protein
MQHTIVAMQHPKPPELALNLVHLLYSAADLQSMAVVVISCDC